MILCPWTGVHHVMHAVIAGQGEAGFGFGSNSAASKFLGAIGGKASDGLFHDEDATDLPEADDGENVSAFLSSADQKLAALESGSC